MSTSNLPSSDSDFSFQESDKRVAALNASLTYTYAQLRIIAKIHQEYRLRITNIPSSAEHSIPVPPFPVYATDALYTDIILHNNRIIQLIIGGGKAYIVPSFNIEPLYRINLRSMTHFELSRLLPSFGQEKIRDRDFFPFIFTGPVKLPELFVNAVLQLMTSHGLYQHEDEILDALKGYGLIPENTEKDFIQAHPELFIPAHVGAEYKDRMGNCYYSLLYDYTVGKDDFGHPRLFAIRLSQVPLLEIDNFLAYQLHHTANDDLARFFRLLEICCLANTDILAATVIQMVQGWKQYKEKQALSLTESSVEKEEESTLAREVLLIYYLLKCNGVILRNTTDVSDVARFIHQVKGRKFTDAANSDIYKKLQRAPFIRKDAGGQIDDLHYIRPLFEKIGLSKAMELIDEDIHRVRMDKGRKK